MKTKDILACVAAIGAFAPLRASGYRLPPVYSAAALPVRHYANTTFITVQPATTTGSSVLQPAPATTTATASKTVQPAATSSSFPILGYVEVPPAPNTPVHFGLMPSWSLSHQLAKLTISIVPGGQMGAYGMFKCQYHCDALPSCVSFYGQFINLGGSPGNSLFECLAFDAFLKPDLYVEDPNPTDLHVCGYNRVISGQGGDQSI